MFTDVSEVHAASIVRTSGHVSYRKRSIIETVANIDPETVVASVPEDRGHFLHLL